MSRTTTAKLAVLGALAFLLLPVSLAAQSEGYDPLLQITHQFAHPNILIVLDVSGSMAWSPTSDYDQPGVDSLGLPELYWEISDPSTSSQGCAQYHNKYTWTFTLVKSSRTYSRMDAFKNALGNSVPLYKNPAITWPASWPTSHSYGGITYAYKGNGLWTYTTSCIDYYPDTPPPPFPANWTYDPNQGWVWSNTNAWTLPDYSKTPVIKATIDGWDPNLTPSQLPQNLVGLSSKTVNWGLEVFSTSFKVKLPDGTTTASANAHRIVDIVADDTQSVQDAQVAKIQPFLKVKAYGGFDAYNNTATSYGLNLAKAALNYTYTSGGTGGTADPMIACGRTYGVVLVTDGASNTCNPDGGYQSCGTQAPSNWDKYPEGRTDELFVKAKDSGSECQTGDITKMWARTFVIGVSSSVSRCELNLDAYMGRTDASSANGDAGMDIAKDKDASSNYRLPLNVPWAGAVSPLTTGTTTSTSNYRSVSSSCSSNCKDYAFFASDPSALYDAFSTIVAAMATGDYTTSAPVASAALGTGTVALLASTEYPGWKGHLYAYDSTNCDLSGCTLKAADCTGCPSCDKCTGTAANPVAAPPILLWDAGYNLRYSTGTAANPAGTDPNPAYVAPSARKIYTWNPSTNALIQIKNDTATASTLNSLCSSCGITDKVLDYTIGYDGTKTSTIRPWVLGSSINSTPAVTQAAEKFLQGNVEDHGAFESAHADRTPLVWVGADDGMLHAFKLSNGSEVLALLPPNLLAKQVQFYAKYNAAKAPTGEPGMPSDHIYGLAGSPKYGDIYFGAPTKDYKTIMLVTEGPGGDLISGIDVTDPTTTTPPVAIKWTKTGADWAGLFQSWSTPSSGAKDKSNWTGIAGGGFNSGSYATPSVHQVDPKTFMFDPTTGNVGSTLTLASKNSSPAPLVGNQAFADSVIYQMSASAYYPDNLVDLALQPDLNGRIWFVPGPNFTSCSVGIDATEKITADGISQQQPIYYPPAVNAYTAISTKYDLYAFASGTFYERSAAVTGAEVGKSGYFIPSIYLVAKPQTVAKADTSMIVRIPIQDLYVPENVDINCPDAANQKTVAPWNQVFCTATSTYVHLGLRTQVTAAPSLFVPIEGASGDPIALFLLYDPDAANTCAGASYIMKVAFNVSTAGAPVVKSTALYSAGEGAASGFAVAGTSVIIAKSAVGQGKRATVSKVPGVNPTSGMGSPAPIWWRELK